MGVALRIQDFHGIVAECGHEQTLLLRIERQMIDPALDVGQRDQRNLLERLCTLRLRKRTR